jgi:hypothetical protein
MSQFPYATYKESNGISIEMNKKQYPVDIRTWCVAIWGNQYLVVTPKIRVASSNPAPPLFSPAAFLPFAPHIVLDSFSSSQPPLHLT